MRGKAEGAVSWQCKASACTEGLMSVGGFQGTSAQEDATTDEDGYTHCNSQKNTHNRGPKTLTPKATTLRLVKRRDSTLHALTAPLSSAKSRSNDGEV